MIYSDESHDGKNGKQYCLPKHSARLHLSFSISDPLQPPPPTELTHVRMRILVPLPHVVEQGLQGCHGDQ